MHRLYRFLLLSGAEISMPFVLLIFTFSPVQADFLCPLLPLYIIIFVTSYFNTFGIPQIICCLFQDENPVSYTHLDVYKRQLNRYKC